MARHKRPQLAETSSKLVLEEGATRTDDVLVDYSLIPQIIEDVLGARFSLGAISHGKHNWKQGGRQFILSCFSRYQSHKSRLLYGDGKDDDLGAMMWNVCVLAWFRKNKLKEYEAALEEMK